MDGVNAELAPLVRMTAPESVSTSTIFDWPVQTELFSSWILLFGFLPIDRHRFFLESVDPQSGFRERSCSWVNAYWCHEREIVPSESGCRVTDAVEYKSRVPLMDFALEPVYRLVFWLRHRHLRRWYGQRAG